MADLPAKEASRRDWALLVNVTKAVLAVIGAGLATVLAYAASTYVKDSARSEAAIATAPYAALPPKVQSLEEFKGRQEQAQQATSAELKNVVIALTALKATTDTNQAQQQMANARVLDGLDRIERRARAGVAVTGPGN